MNVFSYQNVTWSIMYHPVCTWINLIVVNIVARLGGRLLGQVSLIVKLRSRSRSQVRSRSGPKGPRSKDQRPGPGLNHVPLISAMLPNQSCWFWLRDVLWGRPPDKLLLLNAPLFLKSIYLYKNQTQRRPLTLFGRDYRQNSKIVYRWQ